MKYYKKLRQQVDRRKVRSKRSLTFERQCLQSRRNNFIWLHWCKFYWHSRSFKDNSGRTINRVSSFLLQDVAGETEHQIKCDLLRTMPTNDGFKHLDSDGVSVWLQALFMYYLCAIVVRFCRMQPPYHTLTTLFRPLLS